MSEPIALVTVARAAQQDAIERLELMLEQARSGEVVSVAIAFVKADGAIGSHWSRADRIGMLLGAVAYLQQRLVITATEEEG